MFRVWRFNIYYIHATLRGWGKVCSSLSYKWRLLQMPPVARYPWQRRTGALVYCSYDALHCVTKRQILSSLIYRPVTTDVRNFWHNTYNKGILQKKECTTNQSNTVSVTALCKIVITPFGHVYRYTTCSLDKKAVVSQGDRVMLQQLGLTARISLNISIFYSGPNGSLYYLGCYKNRYWLIDLLIKTAMWLKFRLSIDWLHMTTCSHREHLT